MEDMGVYSSTDMVENRTRDLDDNGSGDFDENGARDSDDDDVTGARVMLDNGEKSTRESLYGRASAIKDAKHSTASDIHENQSKKHPAVKVDVGVVVDEGERNLKNVLSADAVDTANKYVFMKFMVFATGLTCLGRAVITSLKRH